MHTTSPGVVLSHFINRPADSALLLYIFLITDIKASIPYNLLHGRVERVMFENQQNKGWGQAASHTESLSGGQEIWVPV